MKVYVVTYGEYSDYGIEAVFSTKEKAQEYINIACTERDCWSSTNDCIEEYELDQTITAPEKVLYSKESGEWRAARSWEEDDEDANENLVWVNFHPDKNVMAKAAEDRLQMLWARDMGL